MKKVWISLIVLVSCTPAKNVKTNILDIYNNIPKEYIINNPNIEESYEVTFKDRLNAIVNINKDSSILIYRGLESIDIGVKSTVQLVNLNNNHVVINYTSKGYGNDNSYIEIYDIENESTEGFVSFSDEAFLGNAKVYVDLSKKEIRAEYSDKVEKKTFKEIISKLNK